MELPGIPMNLVAFWVAFSSIIVPLFIAFRKKEKLSNKRILSTNKIIYAFSSVIGFALLSFGTWGLYVSTHSFYNCITTPNANLTNCGTISNDDFPFVVLQIIGIFIPIFTMLWTTNFKKDIKEKSTG